MTITCAHCGEQRPHEARNLCRTCYEKARLLGMLAAYPKAGWAKAKSRAAYWREYKREWRARRATTKKKVHHADAP